LFCCTLFPKGKSKNLRVQGPQDLPSPSNRFGESMQQKSDSHCFRANPEDSPSFLAPFTYESLFCCTLFPKGKSKNLRVQGPQDLPSPSNRFGESMQQKSDSHYSRAILEDHLTLSVPLWCESLFCCTLFSKGKSKMLEVQGSQDLPCPSNRFGESMQQKSDSHYSRAILEDHLTLSVPLWCESLFCCTLFSKGKSKKLEVQGSQDLPCPSNRFGESMQQKSDSHCSRAIRWDLLTLSAPFTSESLFCCTLFPKGKTKNLRVQGPQDLPSPSNRFGESLQQKSDSHCSRANLKDPLRLSAPFTSESLFCCTLFPKGKSKNLRVQGPQDLPSPSNRFGESLQQKSDSHCSRANLKDPLRLSAPFTSESLFCCTLFPKGKSKNLRVQGPQDLPSPSNRFGESMQQKSDSHCSRAKLEDPLSFFVL
jgi:hypothetical protein